MIESVETNSLCYDDILLVPGLSNIASRSEVSLVSRLGNPNNPEAVIDLINPIIVAPMEYISSIKILKAVSDYGGLGFIHRFQSNEDKIKTYEILKNDEPNIRVGIAIGIEDISNGNLLEIINSGCKVILLDIAFSHTSVAVESIKKIRSIIPNNIHLMTGNSSSIESYSELMLAGADSVRIGIGGGAACTTRTETGFGVPVLGSIMDIYGSVSKDDINGIIADGGIKSNGDIVKALAAGASAVMMGRMFAQYEECDGFENGTSPFRGLASLEMQSENFSNINIKEIHIEGVSGKIKTSGSILDGLPMMINSIKSGLSYAGAEDLKDFRDKVKFIRVSPQSVLESQSRI